MFSLSDINKCDVYDEETKSVTAVMETQNKSDNTTTGRQN